ncbi:MAG: aspartate/glutamate racemase family protein [Deltaproteobacteria bacterium]|nr:aspartate/glutamate racemase family protein [Deltaproteobacteria bacterium]
MIGFKARIGLLIPSTNVIAEPEFYAMAPSGVTFHFARLEHRTELGLKKYENMINELSHEVKKLTQARVGTIAFTCTTGSLYGGKGYNEWVEEQIRKVAAVNVTSTSSAVLEALRDIKARKISVFTPYSKEVNELEAAFLESNGFQVLSIRSLDTRGVRHSDIDEELLFDQVSSLGDDGCEAVFLSCTGLSTITVLGRIEAALERPVISSNQATMWKLKTMLGLSAPASNFGSLLSEMRIA